MGRLRTPESMLRNACAGVPPEVWRFGAGRGSHARQRDRGARNERNRGRRSPLGRAARPVLTSGLIWGYGDLQDLAGISADADAEVVAAEGAIEDGAADGSVGGEPEVVGPDRD